MPIKLQILQIVLLNVIGWPVIHLSLAWFFSRLPDRLFAAARRTGDVSPVAENSPHSRGARAAQTWESKLYSRLFAIRIWKRWLPDGAPWVSGIAKKNLQSTNLDYLQKFTIETCRGEAAHWAMMFAGIVFFLWNPPWADAVMIAYAITANLPCIITQRYNRLRIGRLLRVRPVRSGRRKIAL